MFEMSQILNCGIDQHTLSILVQLVENGVNPEALAAVVKELKRESEALKVIRNLGCSIFVFRRQVASDFCLGLLLIKLAKNA